MAKRMEDQHMNAVTPSLTFKDRAEEAIKLYTSVIKNSKIGNIMRSDGAGIPKGSVLHGSFELDGREFTAMDGGPSFTFSEGFSLVATCDTQEELDNVWKRLLQTVEKRDAAVGSRIGLGSRGRSFRKRSAR